MLKSGLIAAGVTFLVALGLTVIVSPICSPCVAILVGLGAGYLAGVFDKPANNNSVLKAGAGAGAIGGVGALLALAIGGTINAVLVGPEGAAEFVRQIGLPTNPELTQNYYSNLVVMSLCISIVNIALMAGLGAIGGLLWWQISGKNQTSAPFPYE